MKKDKGIAIELIIGFMVVVFAICTLITTTVVSMETSKRIAVLSMEDRIAIDQIGEYYLRAVENGWSFPTGTETSDDAYPSWIAEDSNALSFFKSCKKDGYSYGSFVAREYGSFSEFFKIKGTGHKLLVKKSDNVVLYILIAETPEDADSYKPSYEVLNWSYSDINDGLTYDNRDESHSLLWRIWYWIGNTFFNK